MAKSRLGSLWLVCLFAVACGDKSPTGPTPPRVGDNSGQLVMLRGGERLAWDQPAESPQIARSFGFRLYVDGAPAVLADLRCGDVRTAAGYECSGLLPVMAPGRHALDVTAMANGQESSHSASLMVMVSSGLSSADPAAAETAER